MSHSTILAAKCSPLIEDYNHLSNLIDKAASMACQLDPPLSLEPLITCSSLNQINSNALQHLIATFYAIQDTNAVPKDLFLFDVDAETDKFNNDDSRFVNHKFSKWLDSQQDDEEQDQGDDEIRITSQIETFIYPDEAYLSTCKHSFSNAILQFITQAGGRCECPVSGCRSYLTANDVAIDRGLRRRIQKFRESQVEEDDY